MFTYVQVSRLIENSHMFHPLPLYIGFRYLRGRSGDKFGRFVSYMSTAGITIGVAALITVLAVMNGFEKQLKERILGVLPHAIISYQTKDTDSLPEIEKKLAGIKGIEGTASLLMTEAVVQSAVSIGAGQLMGIDPSSHEPISAFLYSGVLSALTPRSYKLILGGQLARSLGVGVGDKVRVMVTSASQFTPIGRIPAQRNFTVAGLYETATDVDGQFFYANIEDVSRLMRIGDNSPPPLRLFIEEPFTVSQLAKQIETDEINWSDWRSLRGELFQAVKMEKNIMALMLGLIVLVAAFNIISALIMVVMEKQSEVAILKTQGMTERQVVALFIVQGASSGIIGALLGGMLGVFLALNVNTLILVLNINVTGGVAMPVSLAPLDVLSIVIGAILLSLLATLLPSIKAAKVLPAEALRYE